VVAGPCPTCACEIEYIDQTENIHYFSDILIISALCPECGYRFTDTQVLAEGEPARFEFTVENTDDLSVRIVRSMTSAIEIPELGVRIDPGPACEGFVSNVEGVLNRIDQVLGSVLVRAEDETERQNALVLKEKIAVARAGEFPFTIILVDPSGNSAILSDRAVKTRMEITPGEEVPGKEEET
jgi:zinc finger protein